MKSLLVKLASFQKSCPPIVKDASNPFFKSKYATLDAIQHHIKDRLSDVGLVVTQPTVIVDGIPYVKSILYDVESGESIESLFPIVVSKASAQEYGSAVSYAKRYSISGLLNLVIQDEDDDGEGAEGRKDAHKEDERPWLNKNSEAFTKAIEFIHNGGSIINIEKKYRLSKEVRELLKK